MAGGLLLAAGDQGAAMTRATYRCACGWSARRLARVPHIECEECHRVAYPVDPTPGRPAAPPELARAELRVRPLASSIAALGEERAREIARAAVERAAKRGDAKTRRA